MSKTLLFRTLCQRLMNRVTVAPRSRNRRSREMGAPAFVESLELRPLLSALPIGSEFLVNTTTANDQGTNPGGSIAVDAEGNSVVTWTSAYNDGSGSGIFAQRYNSDGVALGSELQVNTFTYNDQFSPAVAMDTDGDFVITWSSHEHDGSDDGVYAQRFDAAGVAQGAEFQVNSTTTNRQRNSAVAMDANGDFVVTWTSYYQDGLYAGIYAQRFDASGIPQGGEFRVNSALVAEHSDPAVAMDEVGNFVVTWTSFNQDGPGSGIYAQRYDASGLPVGTETLVNTTTTGYQYSSSIAMNASGEFIVSWTSSGQDGDGDGVYAQRFEATGIPLGSEFLVNTTTMGQQNTSAVAMNTDGNVVIIWSGGPIFDPDIYMQQYDASGAAIGTELRVNATTESRQRDSAVGMDADGDIFVTWSSYNQDGSGYGVYAQRYQFGWDDNGTGNFDLPVAGDYRVVISGGDTIELWNSHNDMVASRAIGSESLVINGTEGDDSLSVDFSGGTFSVPIVFNGGSQATPTGDRLVMLNGTFATGEFAFSNDNEGEIILAGNSVITYSGLEPIDITGTTVEDLTFRFDGGSEAITLNDAPGAAMVIDSTLGESVTFSAPLSSLTIDAGTGNDSIAIESVDDTSLLNADLTIHGGTGDDVVNLNCDMTFGNSKSLIVDLQSDDPTPGVGSINVGANVTLILSGAGAATFSASRSIEMQSGSSLVTTSGAIVMQANQQVSSTIGTFSGISLDGAVVQSSTGDITLSGIGGTAGDGNVGIRIQNAAQIRSLISGAVTLNGTGVGSGGYGGSSNHGVMISGTDSKISAVSGAITVTGANGLVAGANNEAVLIESNATIESTGGDVSAATVSISGNETSAGTGPYHEAIHVVGATVRSVYGAISLNGRNFGGRGDEALVLRDNALVESTGIGAAAATITLVGTCEYSQGAAIGISSSTVRAIDGAITITGTADSNAEHSNGGDRGVIIQDGSLIQSTGTGATAATIQITGSAGNPVGHSNYLSDGVYISGSGTLISSVGGDISITGTGGPDSLGTGADYDGVLILAGAAVMSTGTGEFAGAITIVGAGGPFSAGNDGIVISGGAVSAVDGAVTLVGTANGISGDGVRMEGGAGITISGVGLLSIEGTRSGSSTYGIAIRSDSNITSNAPSNVLISDQLDLAGSINAGSNLVTLRQKTNGMSISLGGTDATDILGLTDAELGRINAGTISIGDSNSGTLSVDGTIDHDDNVTLTTGAGIVLNQSLTLASGKVFTANTFGNTICNGIPAAQINSSDVTLNGTLSPGLNETSPFHVNGSVAFGGTAAFALNLNGVGEFDQLIVGGDNRTITLADAELLITLDTIPPVSGLQVYRIVDSIGSGSIVSGTFKYGGVTLDDGDTFTVGSTLFTIHYTAGDVTLTTGSGAELVGSTVLVYGTSAADLVTISEAETLTVVVNGVPTDFPAADVTAISVFGYAGNDTITVSSLLAGTGLTADGGDDNDVLTVNSTVAASTTLLGGLGNDTLVGGGGNDTLIGEGGNDALNGGAGNDFYEFNTTAPQGSDSITEGTGIDTLTFAGSLAGVSINLGLTTAQAVNGNLTLTLKSGSSIENIIGGSGNDTLTGNALANTLTGGGGNDSLSGAAGNDVYLFNTNSPLGADSVTDSTGIDTVSFLDSTSALVMNLGLTTPQVVNGNLTLTLGSAVALENLIGGAGNDFLTGNALNNMLTGGEGNDTYLIDADSTSGSDRIDETAGGLDTIDFSQTTTQNVAIDLARTTAQVVNPELTLTLLTGTLIENVIGGALDDTLAGNSLDNTLNGGFGNDTYVFDTDLTLGSDTIIESAGGVDTLNFSTTTPRDIAVDLSIATAQYINAALTLTLSSNTTMENVIGGYRNDTLIGNALDNVLNGGGGNDVYFFNTNTSLGSDKVTDTAGINTLSFAGSTADVVVDLARTTAQPVNGNLALTLDSATTIDNVTGGAGNDTFVGNSLKNILAGGAGNDTYVFDADLTLGTDTIDESEGGADTLTFSSTTTQNVTVDLSKTTSQKVSLGLYLIILGGDTIENVVGGELDDTLSGNSLDNLLAGGNGNDTYVFDTDLNLGHDTIDESGAGSDTLNFSTTTIRDLTVDLSMAGAQIVNAGLTLTLSSGTTIENAIGGSLNDTLIGNSLNNALTGGAGNDTYVFNTSTVLGADTVADSSGTDTVSFIGSMIDVVANLGVATAQFVNSHLTLTLGSAAAIENLTGGSGNDILIGNGLNNVLTGADGNDVLSGVSGNDILAGEDGRNILIGGAGLDTLTGGSSEDLLLGARYESEGDDTALTALLSEWMSFESFENRMAHLLGTLPGGANGSYILNSTTVKEDAAKDTLVGGSGKDWYLRNNQGAVVSKRDVVSDSNLDSVFTEISAWL